MNFRLFTRLQGVLNTRLQGVLKLATHFCILVVIVVSRVHEIDHLCYFDVVEISHDAHKLSILEICIVSQIMGSTKYQVRRERLDSLENFRVMWRGAQNI